MSTICFLYFTYKDLDKESETVLWYVCTDEGDVQVMLALSVALPDGLGDCKYCFNPVIHFICVFCPSSLI